MGEFDYLRPLAERATPGPWAVPAANVFRVIAPDQPHSNSKQGITPPYPWRVVADMGEHDGDAHDAAFIANVSPDVVLRLLDEIARLEALQSGESEPNAGSGAHDSGTRRAP